MEVDTGAFMSMAESTFRRLWPERCLSTTTTGLCAYSKEHIPICSTNIKVSYDSETAQLPLINVKGDRPTLLELGRN